VNERDPFGTVHSKGDQKLVQHDYLVAALDQMTSDRRPDEAGAPGNEGVHDPTACEDRKRNTILCRRSMITFMRRRPSTQTHKAPGGERKSRLGRVSQPSLMSGLEDPPKATTFQPSFVHQVPPLSARLRSQDPQFHVHMPKVP